MPGEWALSTYFRAILSRLKHVSDINSVYLEHKEEQVRDYNRCRGTRLKYHARKSEAANNKHGRDCNDHRHPKQPKDLHACAHVCTRSGG